MSRNSSEELEDLKQKLIESLEDAVEVVFDSHGDDGLKLAFELGPELPKLAYVIDSFRCTHTMNGWICDFEEGHKGPHLATCDAPFTIEALWDSNASHHSPDDDDSGDDDLRAPAR